MTTEQALQVIKQTLDLALKSGQITNLEHASTLIQAFAMINNKLKENV